MSESEQLTFLLIIFGSVFFMAGFLIAAVIAGDKDAK